MLQISLYEQLISDSFTNFKDSDYSHSWKSRLRWAFSMTCTFTHKQVTYYFSTNEYSHQIIVDFELKCTFGYHYWNLLIFSKLFFNALGCAFNILRIRTKRCKVMSKIQFEEASSSKWSVIIRMYTESPKLATRKR